MDQSQISLMLLSLLAIVLGFFPAYLVFPGFIARTRGDRLRALACVLSGPAGPSRMKAMGNVGSDVNKKGKPLVAESGGTPHLLRQLSTPCRACFRSRIRPAGQIREVRSFAKLALRNPSATLAMVAVLSFSISMFTIAGIASLSNINELPAR